MLLHECGEQTVECRHDVGFAVNFEGAVLLDCENAFFLDVAGDLSRATENAVILDGRVHKLGDVTFDYRSGDFMRPWHFTDEAQRLDLTFTPFKDRTARTNLGVIFSEVHQMFGRYNGRAVLDDGTTLEIRDLIGFAEEHRARW